MNPETIGTKKDIGWKYNYLSNPKDPNAVTCNFCHKITKGGIYRAKQHQVGKFKNAQACKKCPQEVKDELEANMNEKKAFKIQSSSSIPFPDFDDINDDDVDEEDEVQEILGKRAAGSSSKKARSGAPRQKGPMDLYVMQKPDKGAKNMKQQNIRDACDKEARARTIQYIARFFYQAGVAFNAANLDSFKWMVEAIGRYGPGLKPPSYHELRVPLLKKELEYTNDLLKEQKEYWKKYGCSIMSDAWSDRKSRTIINFLVNCSYGTMFVESVDVTDYSKTGEKLFELLDKFVDRIGEENVVQIVSDNGSNYVLAGKLLEAKRKHLYWTPCAAHCVDLMLEDIGKIPSIKTTLMRAIFLIGFLYQHGTALSMMRRYTKKRDMVKCGVTRFATTFLTLQRVRNQKQNLRSMFTSEEWAKSNYAKSVNGKKAQEIVLMASFWNSIAYILKIMSPIVCVLRLADSEKKPAMGYIFEAMARAKEAIEKSFEGNEAKYKDIFKIIDRRWECQLSRPLHAAGHFLNPEFFYSDASIETNEEVVKGLYSCIERLVPSITTQDKILEELSIYKKAEGLFGSAMAKRGRATKAPAEWWSLHGSSTPNLQQLAIKILSLTCSSSGCERNWSIFEQIHSKKRNRLEHKKLHDLVYVKYNQNLKARYDMRNVLDPISLQNIDESNEWLIGEMGANCNAEDELVFEDADLTWGDVTRASGVEELRTYTRQRRTHVNVGEGSSSSSRSMNKGYTLIDEDSDEEVDDEPDDGYNESNDELDNNMIDLDE